MKAQKEKFVALMVAALMGVAVAGRADEAATHTAAPAPAAVEEPTEEKAWSASVNFDIWSEYIFRGVEISSGDDVMYNPSVTFAWNGITAYYWGAFNDSDAGDTWYEETDLGIDYTFSVLDEKLSLTGGFLAYLYQDGISGVDTYEIYGKASYDTFLTPTASLFWDIDEFHGGYLTFSVSHSFDVGGALGLSEPMALSIDPSAALSIDLGYWSRATDSNVALNDLLLGVKVPWQITEAFQVHACVQVSIALDSMDDIGQGDEIIGNIGASYSF